jgi:LysM repeat protein
VNNINLYLLRIYYLKIVDKYIMNWFKLSQYQESEKTYVVQSGDTLSGIAKKILNNIDRWPEIQSLNKIQNPNLLKPGQILKMPSLEKQDNPKPSQYPSSTSQPTSQPISQSVALEALKKEISRTEGSYGAYNRGKAGDTSVPQIDITKLTIGQIMGLQASGKLFAVGKYQMIPVTLKEAVNNKRIGLNESDVFNPQNQEKLFMYLIYKRPNLMAYIEGKSNNIDAAVNDLAKEFASLPNTSGKGHYDGDKAGNKASGGLGRVEKIKEIINNLKNSLFVAGGTQDAGKTK